MRIVFHHVCDEQGNIWIEHSVDTDDPVCQQTIANLASGKLDAKASGWLAPSGHKDYKDATHLEVLIAEGLKEKDPLIIKHFYTPSPKEPK